MCFINVYALIIFKRWKSTNISDALALTNILMDKSSFTRRLMETVFGNSTDHGIIDSNYFAQGYDNTIQF